GEVWLGGVAVGDFAEGRLQHQGGHLGGRQGDALREVDVRKGGEDEPVGGDGAQLGLREGDDGPAGRPRAQVEADDARVGAQVDLAVGGDAAAHLQVEVIGPQDDGVRTAVADRRLVGDEVAAVGGAGKQGELGIADADVVGDGDVAVEGGDDGDAV